MGFFVWLIAFRTVPDIFNPIISSFRVKETLQQDGNHMPNQKETGALLDDQSSYLKESAKALQKISELRSMTKSLNGLHPFTFNAIVRHVQKSGKRMPKSPDYMAMKPFERGVNCFVKGYLHSVYVLHSIDSRCFYVRASCYRSLRKSETPHRIKLAISTQVPYDVLGSFCT